MDQLRKKTFENMIMNEISIHIQNKYKNLRKEQSEKYEQLIKDETIKEY